MEGVGESADPPIPYNYSSLARAFGPYPEDYIHFPTTGERHWQRYSAKSACPWALEGDHLLARQLLVHKAYLTNPPLGGRNPMVGVDVETAEMRNRTICQVGRVTCVHVVNHPLPPT
jgi:hypothetical protein